MTQTIHTPMTNIAGALPRRRFNAMPLWARLLASIALILAVVWSVMIYLTYTARRDSSIAQAQNFAESVNQMTLSTVTAMMITGVVQQRGVFLDQIRNSNDVNDIRVFRHAPIVAQFGPGTADSAPTPEEKTPWKMGGRFSRSRKIKVT